MKKDPLPALVCIGTFTRVYGLLYVYTLEVRGDEPLLFKDFHSYWRLRCSGTLVHLLELRRLESRSRTQLQVQFRLQVLESSTRREPSQFEVIEAAMQLARARAPPQCSKCHVVGYRRGVRVCP